MFIVSLHVQVQLENGAAEVRRLKAALRGAARRHPPGFRNRTWPAGLRDDPSLAPVPPDNRCEHRSLYVGGTPGAER